MPELPEVETVVRTLENQVGNATINSVEVIYNKIVDNVSVKDFCEKLVGQKFEQYCRKGKYLIFKLTDYVLIAHLRMEGKFYVYRETVPYNKHTHVVFHLDNCDLHYNDVRKFGRFYLYKNGEPLEAISKLGYEPFDENLTGQYLKNYCRGNKTAIKTVLLDQSMITGIGNIYADEICFASGINPLRPACFLSVEKWEKIIESTKDILSNAIKAGGTTIRSYTSSLGVTGLFQLSLKVHSREDNCDNCGSAIIREKVNGRSTYYCPTCQKEKAVLVGITGTIGSGKSTVTNYLASKGYKCISCDEINRNLLTLDETKEKLAEIFGVEKDLVNKQLIAQKIFSDEKIKLKVEEYLHSKIKEEVLAFYKANIEEKLVFVEVPLLFEANWDTFMDYIITVYCDDDTALERLVKYRNMSENDALKRLRSQKSVDEKLSKSDASINNDGSQDKLMKNIEKVLNVVVKLV